MSVLLSLSVSLWFIARKGKGAQCVTYRHTYMHVYRPSDKRVSGEQLLLLKKKETKKGVKVRGFDFSRSREKERY